MNKIGEDKRLLRITEENAGDDLIALEGTANNIGAHVDCVKMQTNIAMITEYAKHERLDSAEVEPCIY